MVTLGKIKEIKDLREAWPNEALDFTPWLAKNISILGEAVGIDISVQERIPLLLLFKSGINLLTRFGKTNPINFDKI